MADTKKKMTYKVGDMVKLVSVRPHGWNCEGKMDHYLGRTVKITEIYGIGFHFKFDGMNGEEGSRHWCFNIENIAGLAWIEYITRDDFTYFKLKSLSCESILDGKPCSNEFDNYVREAFSYGYSFREDIPLKTIVALCEDHSWLGWLIDHEYIRRERSDKMNGEDIQTIKQMVDLYGATEKEARTALAVFECRRTLPSAGNSNHRTFWLPDRNEAPVTLGLVPLVSGVCQDSELMYCQTCDDGYGVRFQPFQGDASVIQVIATGEFSIEAVWRKRVPMQYVEDMLLPEWFQGAIGIEEGACCGRNGCPGTIKFRTDGPCTCHVAPPCSACVGSYLVCPVCGWEAEHE